MLQILITAFGSAVFLSIIFTIIIKKIAIKFNIIDIPDQEQERKIHKKATPLLGGMAIFLSFFIILFFFQSQLLLGGLVPRHWLGFFIGACFLMVGGILDDKFNLKPELQIIWPILAALAVVAGGVEIGKITNPLGDFFYLDSLRVPILEWGGSMHYFVVISDLLIVFWLMGMMYTTKLLDGIDGLVSGIISIGAIVIFIFTISTKYYQPDIALAALVLAGASLGFLIFNWHPAKIFLGEGGSLFLGFALGVLAIISGGKIAIALLIMGLPILDVAWTIIRRLRAKKNPFKFSDNKHLHFRLLDFGFGHKKTVLIYCFIAALFGLSALFLQSLGKLLALGILIMMMFGIIGLFSYLDKKNKNL